MITAAQLRAARGLLDWSRSDLSKASKVSQETIKNIEHGIFRPQEMTECSILNAFAAQGVEFMEDDGVRKSQNRVITHEGADGFKRFLDDVFETTKLMSIAVATEKPTCISYVDDNFFIKHLGDFLSYHIQRMNKLDHAKTKILIEDKPYSYSESERQTSSYREYRKHPFGMNGNVPFYVYGDKLAILVFDETKPPQIVVIVSQQVAKAYRDQFHIMWEAAVPLTRI